MKNAHTHTQSPDGIFGAYKSVTFLSVMCGRFWSLIQYNTKLALMQTKEIGTNVECARLSVCVCARLFDLVLCTSNNIVVISSLF